MMNDRQVQVIRLLRMVTLCLRTKVKASRKISKQMRIKVRINIKGILTMTTMQATSCKMIEQLILLSIGQVARRCKLLCQFSFLLIEISLCGDIAVLYVSPQSAIIDSPFILKIFLRWAVNCL